MRLGPLPAAAVLLAALAACGNEDDPTSSDEPTTATSTPPATMFVSGSIEVPEADYMQGLDKCYADDGYDDITDGAQVTVFDSAGVVLALGALELGESHEYDSDIT